MFPFDNSYARLPRQFFARIAPSSVGDPQIVKVNRPLAVLLGVDADLLDSPSGAQVLAGNAIPDGADPMALAYAGHQFGNFVPQLGDGRAILLGEIVGRDGVRRDVQLKGAGRTPFSRGGDGRAALGPVLREYVVSEAMCAMGIPTTRALAAVTTGERVLRDEDLPGAVLTRVAASHVRVGTFQYFAAAGDVDALRSLTSYALARHYPDALGTDNDPLALLDRVIDAHAKLVAHWLGVGFVHGVMNTDNTSISGETLDYGPCAFLDEYDPSRTFSSIDRGGRYAFANQPRAAQWNMARFAEALLPLISESEDDGVRLATACLEQFGPRFERAHLGVMRAKLGLMREVEADRALVDSLLTLLASHRADYTRFFRGLCHLCRDGSRDEELTASLGIAPEGLRAWLADWRLRRSLEVETTETRLAKMRRTNPAFIPRNHRVEEAIEVAVRHRDFGPFDTLVAVLARPYDDQPEHAYLAQSPGPEQRAYKTFCGT